MGVETYLMIIATYGLGCFLSYRQGVRNGRRKGAYAVFQDIATIAKWDDTKKLAVLAMIAKLPHHKGQTAINK